MKKAFLKNFAIFTGKRLCSSLFFIKFQAFLPILENNCEQLPLKKKTERKKWQQEPVLKHRVKSRLYVEYVIYPNIDYGIYC